MARLRASWRTSLPVVQQPRNPQSESIARTPYYPSGIWGTYRHWQALGAQVRKGERATTVVFWKEVGSARSDDDGEDEPERRRFLARGYRVFNQAQVDNYEAETPALLPEAARIAQAPVARRSLQPRRYQLNRRG